MNIFYDSSIPTGIRDSHLSDSSDISCTSCATTKRHERKGKDQLRTALDFCLLYYFWFFYLAMKCLIMLSVASRSVECGTAGGAFIFRGCGR